MLKAVAGILLLGMVAACSGPCRNTIVQVVKAPGGQHAAALFRRDCGATTGFSTQISVLLPGEEVSREGNAFIADDNHGEAAVGEWQSLRAELRWLSQDHLLVRYGARSRIFKQANEVSGVTISYEQLAR